MSLKIECQGLPCPQPVIKCKEAIEAEKPAKIKIVVDNEAAKENVSRFLGSKGYDVSVKEKGDLFVVKGKRSDDQADCGECEVMTDEQISQAGAKNLVFLSSEFMGRGDDGLGEKLMFNFIATLSEMGDSLWRIMMVNSAVKLSVEGHPCVEKLKELEKSGVSILVCGTCLDHYGILDKKQVGETTNMLDIVTGLQLASKVIKA